MEATEGRGSVVKCEETPFVRGGIVKIHWDSPTLETVEHIRVNVR